MSRKKLYRSHNKLIGGVCAGIGEHFDMDSTLVRILWVIVAIVSFGFAVLAYLACWAIIPEETFSEERSYPSDQTSPLPPPQAPVCPTCGKAPKYLPKENTWYCYNCGHYVPERKY